MNSVDTFSEQLFSSFDVIIILFPVTWFSILVGRSYHANFLFQFSINSVVWKTIHYVVWCGPTQ